MRLIRFDPPLPILLLMAVLIALATYVRLSGTYWDGMAGLHPDERHMLFMSLDMMRGLDDPAFAHLSLSEWWFSLESPANPRGDNGSYVYGELPYLTVTLLGWLTGNTGWDDVMILGRQVAAVLDGLTVLAVFVLAFSMSTARAAFGAALLYAAVPTALQLANFYTVDTWLTAMSAWSLCAILALARSRTGRAAMTFATLGGVLAGLAVASKITGLALALPMTLALVALWRAHGWRSAASVMAVAALAVLVTFRLANPFAFAGPGVFGLALSPGWRADMISLFGLTVLEWPPNWQWMAGYGALRYVRDFALFGIGPVITLLVLAGLRRPRTMLRWPQAILLSFVAVFVLQGLTSTIPALRYGAPALPALAALSAPVLAVLSLPLTVMVCALALWWGVGAVRLHDGEDHPRLLASRWLWEAPKGTVIVNETGWDEGLPTQVYLEGVKEKRWPGFEDHFTFLTLDIVAPDSVEKADRIARMIGDSDYIAISSGRQREVMPRLPERFPMTTAYYQMLDDPLNCLEVVWSADRGYPLPFLAFDDSWVQEPWRVYDHPIVTIYQRRPCFNAASFAAKLKAALD
jgi:hypothetical protein